MRESLRVRRIFPSNFLAKASLVGFMIFQTGSGQNGLITLPGEYRELAILTFMRNVMRIISN